MRKARIDTNEEKSAKLLAEQKLKEAQRKTDELDGELSKGGNMSYSIHVY